MLSERAILNGELVDLLTQKRNLFPEYEALLSQYRSFSREILSYYESKHITRVKSNIARVNLLIARVKYSFLGMKILIILAKT